MTESLIEPATRVFVGLRSEFPDGTQRIVSLPKFEVGIIAYEGELYAYRNQCAHQGGPVCEGMVIGRVMAKMAADKTVDGEFFSESEPHLVCPWHGMEFLLKTGKSAVHETRGLRAHEVIVEDDRVFIIA
jgi:nitrite reductase/ring-hydroxylating ferredoxin subunit